MPQVEKHTPGTFSWLELATSDQSGAKSFYSALLGWETQDFPMGPAAVYTMFKLKGLDTAGCYQIGSDMQGTPPTWGLYVAVEDADASAAKVASLGGTVLKQPLDVFTFGRMAVIQDPTGAVIHVWQAKTHIGTRISGEVGTLGWADLRNSDLNAARAFYEQLFDWTIGPGKGGGPGSYLHIQNGEYFIGGIVPPEADHAKGGPAFWLIYFQVADCDASTAKAKELGARVYVEPFTVENNLRMSVLADPQGAVFALSQPMF